MKRALVLGLGISGEGAIEFLLSQGMEVVGVDANEQAVLRAQKKGFNAQLDSSLGDAAGFDLVVTSPGWNPKQLLYKSALEKGIELIGETELALRHLKQPCLAITGTNGKTTVTLLCEHVLNASGIKARALGNVGSALCRYALHPNQDEVIVTELSSYQLETMQSSVFDGGVILNITPDHLDRYDSMHDYAKAKCHLAKCLKREAPLFVHEESLREFGALLPEGMSTSYGSLPTSSLWTDKQKIVFKGKEVALPESFAALGLHESENAAAAFALCSLYGVTPEQFSAALKNFRKPSHRIEFVKTINGISYYDDSKGTNIDAVLRAVEAMSGRVILVAGGVDKGSSYSPWISPFRNKVMGIAVIGQAADKMCHELGDAFKVEKHSSLEEAVQWAASLAQAGDTVLLSPGCASFDQFRDYVHRGEEFKRIVNLIERRTT